MWGHFSYHDSAERRGQSTETWEELLFRADFSGDTDPRDRLREKLFDGKKNEKTIPFYRLSDQDAELVNAAMGLRDDRLFEKNRHDL